jgi:WD40 repeat protein
MRRGLILLMIGLWLSSVVNAQTQASPRASLATAYPSIAQIGYSADGALLASSSFLASDTSFVNALQIWDTASNQVLTSLSQEGKTLFYFAFHPSAPLLVTGALEGEVTLWSANAGASSWDILNSALAHDGVPRIQFSADGTRFISYDAQTILLWSSADFAPQLVLTPPSDTDMLLSQAALSRDGQSIAGIYGNSVVIYSASTGEVVKRFATGYDVEPYVAFFSMEGANLALAYQFLEVRSVSDGMIVGQFSGNSDIHVAEVNGAWTRLVTAELGGRVLLWDVMNQAVQGALIEENERFIWDMAFAPSALSPDGQDLLAVARGEGVVEFYTLP